MIYLTRALYTVNLMMATMMPTHQVELAAVQCASAANEALST